MKRSEMILNIATDLIMNSINIDYKLAQELAEDMLSSAEKNGMLPPVTLVENGIDFDKVDNIACSLENKWEEE